MDKIRLLLTSVIRHWLVWMSAGLFIIGLVPAVTFHTIPKRVYWLAAFVCLCVGFYQSWSEEYDKADLHQRELDEMYADIGLDWLKQNNPAIFTAGHIAGKMPWPQYRVERGLKMLEKSFPDLVQDRGNLGWVYSPLVGIALKCQLRRLPAPPKT